MRPARGRQIRWRDPSSGDSVPLSPASVPIMRILVPGRATRSVRWGFLRNRVREVLIARLMGPRRRFRYAATESPLGDDVSILSSTPLVRPLPAPTTLINAHNASRRKSVLVLENAIVDTITNYVYDANLRFIVESSSWSVDHAVLRFPAPPRPPRTATLRGDTLHLGTDAYYHWLIEEVPAYLQARAARPAARTIIRRSPPAYVVDLLRLLGEDRTEVPSSVRLESLTFASRGAAVIPNDVDVQTLHEFRDSLDLPISPARRIYVPRREAGRFPVNEDEVEALVTEAGCEIVHLTGMPLAEQIALFSGAELVIAMHGAGLANAVWCRVGATRVVEIARDGQPDCFATLAALSSLPYTRVGARSGSEWRVDLGELGRAIEPHT